MDSISLYSTAIRGYLDRTGHSRIRPEAALIDMDGTLYDSMVNHTAAWHRLMTEQGVKCTREEFYLYEGRTGASTINELFKREFHREATEEEKESLYKLKTVYFRELPEVCVMPGAQAMVAALRDLSLKRVLVTGSGQSSLINRLDTDYPGLFSPEMRITSRSVKHGKPHPEPFLKAMELAGVSPDRAIVIENAPLGVEAGHRSGAFTVGVTTGPIKREALEEAGADIVFASMPEFERNVVPMILAMRQFNSLR